MVEVISQVLQEVPHIQVVEVVVKVEIDQTLIVQTEQIILVVVQEDKEKLQLVEHREMVVVE